MEWYVIAVLLTLTASALSMGMVLLLWQYRTLHTTRLLLAAGIALAAWSLAYLLQLQGFNLTQKTLWHLLKQPGALFVDVFLLLFALELTRRTSPRILLVVPFIALGVAFFDLGGLFWSLSLTRMADAQPALLVTPQPLYLAYLIFQSGALAVAVVLLAAREERPLGQAALLATGALVLLTRGAPFLFGWPWDYTPAALALLMLVILIVSLQVNLFYGLPDAYSAVIRDHPDGVLILDNQQRVLAVNAAFAAYTGQTAPLLIGTRLQDSLPQVMHWLPDLGTRTNATLEVSEGSYRFEVRILPLVHRQTVRGQALLLRDITAQARAQEALAESETRYRTLFDQAQDAILLEDSRLAIVDANEAAVRLLGYSLNELRTMTSDVIQPQTLRFETPDVKSGRFEIQAIRKDHELLDLEVTVAPIPDGDRLLYMSILRDVTERKQTQAELKQRADELAQLYEQVSRLEQYKTEIIRMAAHDLRQPISITMGYAEILLRDGAALDAQQVERIQAIQKAVARANQILKDILSLERIEQQMTRGTVERFNFHRLLGDMLAQYRDQILEHGHQLQLEIDPDEARYEVIGHASQVAEAVANLIENAIKYTPDGGTLTVSLRNNGTHLIYEVRDTGYGIPPELQDQLFRPFSRARSPEVAHIEGTGLGLHLVKSIVERHQGTILFRSVHGKGSTFGFRLPLRSAVMKIPPQVMARGRQGLSSANATRPLLPPVD
jgi:PAS domain S-box-containing protein